MEVKQNEKDDPGTTWNERARNREPEKITARMAWRAIKAVLPREAIISSDIGNNCAIGNAYPTFEKGRNYQWGAEKRNTTLWFDDNFVGTKLNLDVSYASVAKVCGVEGVQATSMDDLTEKLNLAIKAGKRTSLFKIKAYL